MRMNIIYDRSKYYNEYYDQQLSHCIVVVLQNDPKPFQVVDLFSKKILTISFRLILAMVVTKDTCKITSM